MSGWMETILVASRDAAILALAIGIIVKLSGRRMPARFCHAAWLLVAVRLLMPVLPTSPFSWQRVLSVNESPAVNKGSEVQPAPPVSYEEISPKNLSQPPLSQPPYTIPENFSPEKPKTAISRGASVNAWDIAAGVWLCGAVGLLILGAGTTLRFHRRARRLTKSHPKAADLEMALKRIGAEFGWKGLPHLQITEAVDSPALFGLVRPRILMPPALLDELSDFDLRLVMLHELGHWKRRDIAVNFALALAQAVHWFNPLVWWAFHRARLESERATDDWVLRRTGAEHSADYGEMLLRLLARRARPRAVISGMVSVVENAGDLRQRMTAIGRFNGKRTTLTAAISVILLLGLAAVGLTQAPEPKSDSEEVAVERVTEKSAGGIFTCQVRTTENTPVAGAEVYINVFSQIDGDPLESRYAGKTNGVGEVEIRSDLLGARHASISLFARHPVAGFGAISRGATQIESRISLNINEGLPLRLRVLDHDANPVSGLRLKVKGVQHQDFSESKADGNKPFWGHVPALPEGFWDAVTDAEGRCAIDGLLPGGYYVDHEDSRYAQIPGRHDYGLQFKLKPESPEIEIKLQPAATVSGIVSLPDGTPAAGAQVEILEQHPYKQGGSSAKAITDADGAYHLQRLLSSDYTLRVVLNDEIKEGSTMNAINLSLEPSEQKQGLTILLEKGGWVTGKVTLEDTGEPVSGLIVGINRVTPGVRSSLSGYSTKTDEIGIFRKRLPPGQTKAYVAGLPPKGYTNRRADNSELETTFEVKNGGEYLADFVIPRNTNISGVVLNPSGQPAAGATVTCFDPPDRMSHPQTVTTDKEGRFSFDLPNGTEQAELLATFGEMASESRVRYSLHEEAKLELMLDGFAKASGRVIDQDGRGLEGVRIKYAGKRTEDMVDVIYTNEDGGFDLPKVLPGKLVGFWASKKGYGETMAQADLESGKSVIVKTLVLPRAESLLAGTVVDSKGKPVPGAWVRASGYLQPRDVEILTDNDGRFELNGLVEGWLDVQAVQDAKFRGHRDIKKIRTRTGANNLQIPTTEIPEFEKLEKLVDFVNKQAPPLKSHAWLNSNPLPESAPGKVRFISFVGLDRPLIFFSNSLPKLQEFREANPSKELEIILVHGAWPQEEVREILAADYPGFNLPIAIEPEKGAMSEEFGVQHWLYVVINQQNKVVFQSRSDFSRAKKKALSLFE